MKKRIPAILLIIIMIAPLTGTYIYLHVKKKQIKNQVKQLIASNIDKDKLIYFRFSKHDAKSKLNWKHEKEFEFKGQMFDIVEKQAINDTVHYWCFVDHKESRIIKEINSLVSNALGHDKQRKKNHEKLTDFFKNIFYSHSTIDKPDLHILVKHNSLYINYYKSLFTTTTSPPPEII